MIATAASVLFWSIGALIAVERLLRGGDMTPRASAIYAFALLLAAVSGLVTLLTQSQPPELRLLIAAALLLCAVSGGAQVERARRRQSPVV